MVMGYNKQAFELDEAKVLDGNQINNKQNCFNNFV